MGHDTESSHSDNNAFATTIILYAPPPICTDHSNTLGAAGFPAKKQQTKPAFVHLFLRRTYDLSCVFAALGFSSIVRRGGQSPASHNTSVREPPTHHYAASYPTRPCDPVLKVTENKAAAGDSAERERNLDHSP